MLATRGRRSEHRLPSLVALAFLSVGCATRRPATPLAQAAAPTARVTTVAALDQPATTARSLRLAGLLDGCVLLSRGDEQALACLTLDFPPTLQVVERRVSDLRFSADLVFPRPGEAREHNLLTGEVEQFSTPGDVVAATAGAHRVLILADGRVFADGLGGSHVEPDSSRRGRTPRFEPVEGIAGASRVSSGRGHSCVVAQGGLWCWGANDQGQCGLPASTSAVAPTKLADTADVVEVACGDDFTCVVRQRGTVGCWGTLAGAMRTPPVPGALGLAAGSATSSLVQTELLAVAGIDAAVRVVAGAAHACALLADETVRCWGQDFEGELGLLGSVGFAARPVRARVRGVVDLAAGGTKTCAILRDGTLKCWGALLPLPAGRDELGSSRSQPLGPQTIPLPLDFAAPTIPRCRPSALRPTGVE
jgi:hypothetical protein